MRTALKLAVVLNVDKPLHTDLEITRFASDWRARFSDEPVFLFRNIAKHPRSRVLLNLLKRSIILPSLQLPTSGFLPVACDRLAKVNDFTVRFGESLANTRQGGLDDLPILRHQPGDAGPYLTSFVGCLLDPHTGARNLGFYRVLVRNNRTGVIFIDPRTDAHRILQMAWNGGAHDVGITLYAGGPVASYLAGAAAMPSTEDGYCFAARLGARDIVVDQCAYPSAPVDSEIVLRGRVLHVLADEAPFGEFKGYYCQPTRSHVIEIDEVWCRPDAYFLGLFCGKESGLELMSLPNELLMFQHLRSQGLPVSDVRYPLKAFGEFLTIIDAPFDAAHEVLESAMRFDRRTKAIVVGPAAQSLWNSLSIFDFDAFTLPYTKRSANHGSRLGIVLRRTGDFRWTEY